MGLLWMCICSNRIPFDLKFRPHITYSTFILSKYFWISKAISKFWDLFFITQISKNSWTLCINSACGCNDLEQVFFRTVRFIAHFLTAHYEFSYCFTYVAFNTLFYFALVTLIRQQHGRIQGRLSFPKWMLQLLQALQCSRI